MSPAVPASQNHDLLTAPVNTIVKACLGPSQHRHTHPLIDRPPYHFPSSPASTWSQGSPQAQHSAEEGNANGNEGAGESPSTNSPLVRASWESAAPWESAPP